MSINPQDPNVQYQLAHRDETRAGQLIGADFTLGALAILAVALRLGCRLAARAGWKADDYVMIAALLLALGMCANNLLSVFDYGAGKHAVTLGSEKLLHYLQSKFAFEILYTFTLPTIKISILFLYRRIFVTRKFRAATWIVGAIVMAWFFFTLFGAIFHCSPISYNWNRTIEGHCIDLTALNLATVILNVITDVTILLMPVPMVWKLQIPKQQKFALTGIFCLGGFVCAASIARLVYLVMGGPATDPTWTDVNSAIWSVAEPCIGIVSACLPAMRPLVQGVASGFSSLGSSAKSNFSGSNRTASFRSSWANGRSKTGTFIGGRSFSDGSTSDGNASYVKGVAKDSMEHAMLEKTSSLERPAPSLQGSFLDDVALSDPRKNSEDLEAQGWPATLISVKTDDESSRNHSL